MKYLVRIFAVLASGYLLTGCAEGNSYYLEDGEIEHFLTMARCEREARAAYASGSPRYSGYECRRKILWFTTSKKRFYEGQLQSSTD